MLYERQAAFIFLLKRYTFQGESDDGASFSQQHPSYNDKDGHLVFHANTLLDGRCKSFILKRMRNGLLMHPSLDKTISIVGKGTYGQVFKCYDVVLDKLCAIKVIRAIPKYVEASRIEIRILQALRDYDPSNQK